MLYNGAAARKAAHRGAPVIAVEGYVDVIAMVTAGYAATVAPLGTALTEDQLALLWKMADEPILCFDGDAAAVRAAYRAIDLALPHHQARQELAVRGAAGRPGPGRPRPLRRPGAIAEVLAAARPLADMLWARETESGRFDTPERRAGLEARINELDRPIADEAVRRYYRQDLRERLRTPGCARLRRVQDAVGGSWPANAAATRADSAAVRRQPAGEPAVAGSAGGTRLPAKRARCRRVRSCAARAVRCRRARP